MHPAIIFIAADGETGDCGEQKVNSSLGSLAFEFVGEKAGELHKAQETADELLSRTAPGELFQTVDQIDSGLDVEPHNGRNNHLT